MRPYEYASYWIWDTRNAGQDTFQGLRGLTTTGWEVVGKFVQMPEVSAHAGMWCLRRQRATVPHA